MKKKMKTDIPVLHVGDVEYNQELLEPNFMFDPKGRPRIQQQVLRGRRTVTIRAVPVGNFGPTYDHKTEKPILMPPLFRMMVRGNEVWTCIKGWIPEDIINAILAAHKFNKAKGGE